MYQIGYADDDATEAPFWKYWGEAYGEELPIYADRYGNLCTNMYEDVPVGMSRVFLAFNDGLFDMSIPDITSDTAVEDYPDNVANIAGFFSEDDFNGVFAYMI